MKLFEKEDHDKAKEKITYWGLSLPLKNRNCLKCRKVFGSYGSQNRVCYECNMTNTQQEAQQISRDISIST